MIIKRSSLGFGFADPLPENASEQEVTKAALDKENLVSQIVALATTENLITLCGSGSSLRGKNELGPSMGQLWEKVEKAAGDSFDKIKSQVAYTTEDGRDNIELLLSTCQLHYQLTSNQQVKDFIDIAQNTIAKACDFVTDKTDLSSHESFLRRFARRSSRLPRLKLFTTNYDLCFEEAAKKNKFLMVDGFGYHLPQQFDGDHYNFDFVRRSGRNDQMDFASNVFHLLKLHGSINWEKSIEGQTHKVASTKEPCLIYPRSSKYQLSYDQPYFEMMSRFQSSIREPNSALLIIGFGFNDDHLSAPIESAIRSNVSLRVIVVSPTASSTTDNRYYGWLQKLVASGDSRITLVDGTFDQFVSVIPDLVTSTQEEKHRERVQNNQVSSR